MQKIILISRFFYFFFLALTILVPATMLFAWMCNPYDFHAFHHLLQFNYIPNTYTNIVHDNIVNGFTLRQKSRGAVVGLLPLSIEVYMLFGLSQLFKLYAKGIIFSYDNVRKIKKIAIAFFLLRLIQPIYEALMGLALTWDYSGKRYIAITMTQQDIAMLFLPLLLIVIAWIMAEGCKLQEENQLTI